MGKISKTLLLFFFPIITFAQEVNVNGYFLQDSAKLGERVGYVLKATYPEDKQLIFPDSVYDFSPLVLLEKKTFISSTAEGITQDSSIYYVSNFSLEPSVYLSLPVYEIARYDSITHFPLEAELKLKLTLDSIPEKPAFRENNVYQPLEKPTNWIVIAVVLGGVLLLLIVFYFLFADRIKRLLKDRREKRRWNKFEKDWKKQTSDLEANPTLQRADEVQGLWKSYMEHLTKQPFQEWTSSEIGEKMGDQEVFKALRAIDLIIYAGGTEKSNEATDFLLQVAKEKHLEKLKKLDHARANS
ncbi:hypothetical protein [Algoriphagus machipongonensis]|uniref:Uncharacterized protein n=1 Tax=Algoriphagus machipongonensis TaxID=388413 RepID=A3HZP8_9BACT|nr:hypothetical protein [Algoriphagus machipongonensis]EAZ80734.1 hypothetical protein ALPR1_07410 [Algoriphagus machipongonensis]